MKRRQVFIVAAAAIILGLFWFTHTHREPRYEGKSLSEWLDLCYKSSAPIPEAADAVRHMGTDAVPFLVTWVQQDRPMTPRETRWWQKVWSWKWGTPGRELLLEFITKRQCQAERAFWGFVILGETARAAAPELARVATHGNYASADMAINALTHLGRGGLESLFSVVTNTAAPQRTRLGVMASLRDVAPSARAAFVPELTKLLCDPDAFVRSEATNSLNRIAPEALQQSSVP